MSKPPDLVQGTLDLLILKMLILRPMNGWALAEALKQASADVLRVSSGSLYPALHKLEQEGWITCERARGTFVAASMPEQRARRFAAAGPMGHSSG